MEVEEEVGRPPVDQTRRAKMLSTVPLTMSLASGLHGFRSGAARASWPASAEVQLRRAVRSDRRRLDDDLERQPGIGLRKPRRLQKIVPTKAAIRHLMNE